MSQTFSAEAATRQRRATLGAFVGNAIEWYDFFIFGTAAALVFGRVFYPEVAPGAALLASFATFWVGFLARPLGGMVFGHFGDKLGRKNVLVITLLLMGIATTLIGFLPGFDQIGVMAPILLVALRALQGIAVGGEWGGAVLMATENATEKKKGLAGAWVQQGSPVGSILATVMFLIVGGLPEDDFLSWGWRVPFLVSAVLVIVGLVIRAKVEESADFEAAKATNTVVKAPILEVFRSVPGIMVLGLISSVMAIALAYFTNTFLLSWTTGPLGIPRQTMLNILLGTAIVQFFAQLVAALLAERIGAMKVMVGGLAVMLIAVIPFFLAINSADPTAIAVLLFVTMFGGASYFALLASALAGAFPANIRYSGVSLSYQLCSTLIGGSTPLVAQLILNNSNGSPWGVAAYFAAMIVLTMIGVLGLFRTVARRQANVRTSHPEKIPS